MAESLTEKHLYRKRTGALSQKDIIHSLTPTPPHCTGVFVVAVSQGFEGGGQLGRCWRDGDVAASAVGLAGCSPGDWTGIAEPWI